MAALARDDCPFCRGSGKQRGEGGLDWNCQHCWGTGRRRHLELMSAYRLGIQVMYDAITSGTFETPSVGLDAIQEAVDSYIRGRMLEDLSAQMRREHA